MVIPLWKRTLLEAFGTGFLAFTVGRLSSTEFNGFEQAVSIGLCLALLIHLLGRFSGAHFNPAVTLLLNHQRIGVKAFTTRAGLVEIGAYGSAQILGASIGLGFNPPGMAPDAVQLGGLTSELIFTVVLFALILRWSNEGKICPVAQPMAGLVIGAGLSLRVLLGGLTQSGIYNPAMAIAFGLHGTDRVGLVIVDHMLAVGLLLLAEHFWTPSTE